MILIRTTGPFSSFKCEESAALPFTPACQYVHGPNRTLRSFVVCCCALLFSPCLRGGGGMTPHSSRSQKKNFTNDFSFFLSRSGVSNTKMGFCCCCFLFFMVLQHSVSHIHTHTRELPQHVHIISAMHKPNKCDFSFSLFQTTGLVAKGSQGAVRLAHSNMISAAELKYLDSSRIPLLGDYLLHELAAQMPRDPYLALASYLEPHLEAKTIVHLPHPPAPQRPMPSALREYMQVYQIPMLFEEWLYVLSVRKPEDLLQFSFEYFSACGVERKQLLPDVPIQSGKVKDDMKPLAPPAVAHKQPTKKGSDKTDSTSAPSPKVEVQPGVPSQAANVKDDGKSLAPSAVAQKLPVKTGGDKTDDATARSARPPSPNVEIRPITSSSSDKSYVF